ncbi:lipopolysaccharide transport periplasmic protein LptA [Denitratisoma oestradiolicum]|uniref:Lipopolysaccharide export system protein LptA n=1 Tax=Denitratisoma oestradiolicum TaxID=311182 RepID=A0A6S6XYD7_9PROT|nr:lipopolysaccharide transport periplasmic protein LptA [Denitratisoma oestradiolicum]TWO79085.1 lipopolysaccharide transport periplasmic protein LptA [Denitratisoma oestradiolicum]CAB1369923.1 Lipopolysaccharide export system protein LptA [Denitratisoma oestradiolicum]
MIHHISIVLAGLLLLPALPALAERADRNQPVNLEADRITADDARKIHVFEGKVVLTQGTLTIRADKLVVSQDAEGYQKGIATGGPNGLAHFRQKREGRAEYIEGEAERIEHDAKSEKSEFFLHARVRSGSDEVRGQYVIYDARSETYLVSNGPGGSTLPSTRKQPAPERVRAVIHPKNREESSPSAPVAAPNPAN